ncbi:hypothetical protein M0R72_20780 [Candidatus Pacearchaeota archaeon]|jgi:hypothetical protein|nr:hypothetical protein [Candidatus Pacearchaeota archaeon]
MNTFSRSQLGVFYRSALGVFAANGVLYVGGHTENIGGNYINVIKYSSMGRYNGNALFATDIDYMESDSGGAVIIGGSGATGLIAKYQKNGTLLWAGGPDTINLPAVTGIAVGSDDKIYATFRYSYTSGTPAFGLMVFTSSGVASNVAITPPSGYQSGRDFDDLDVSASGLVAICGDVFDKYVGGVLDTAYSLAVINGSHSLVWYSGIWGTGSDSDLEFRSCVFDAYGNLFASAVEYEAGFDTIFKFDSSGNVLWGIAGGNRPILAADRDGNLYAATYGSISVFSKYDSSGALLWSVEEGEEIMDIKIDNIGFIYVCGVNNSTSVSMVRKYNSAGVEIWSRFQSDIFARALYIWH